MDALMRSSTQCKRTAHEKILLTLHYQKLSMMLIMREHLKHQYIKIEIICVRLHTDSIIYPYKKFQNRWELLIRIKHGGMKQENEIKQHIKWSLAPILNDNSQRMSICIIAEPLILMACRIRNGVKRKQRLCTGSCSPISAMLSIKFFTLSGSFDLVLRRGLRIWSRGISAMIGPLILPSSDKAPTQWI